ncbi:MAG: lipase [Leptospirales bacterium]|nr:lipase [Leptospirales bacterium]
MKKAMFGLAAFFVCSTVFAGGGGSSSKPLQGMYPIVLSHGLFGWGDSDPNGLINIAKYWGGMDDYLRSQGATVYAPQKSAANSNEVRAQELKDKILYYMAANGYSGKVHIVGHSQGTLDSRYMIANLGMASKVSTYTSLAGVHRGSPIADLVKAVIPDWLKPSVSAVLGVLVQLVWGGGQQNALGALNSLTTEGMAAFNNYTPNSAAVKYFSYSAHITIPDLIQHPLMAILQPINAIGGVIKGLGAANDGLVPVESAKWGNYRGEPSYGILTTGIDHLQIANTLWSGQTWYDVEGFFLKFAKEAKTNQ